MGRTEPIAHLQQEQQRQQQHYRRGDANLLEAGQAGRDADAAAAAAVAPPRVARGGPTSRLHHVQVQNENYHGRRQTVPPTDDVIA